MSLSSRRGRIVAVAAVLLPVASLIVWSQLPIIRLSQPVTGCVAGEQQARRLLPARDRDVPLAGLSIGLSGPASQPVIDELRYSFLSTQVPGTCHVVTLSNSRRWGWIISGQGLDLGAIHRVDPYAYTPLDLSAVQIDAEAALTAAAAQVAERFAGLSEPDLQMDMSLRNHPEGLVWSVDFDAWKARTPLAMTMVELDARSGQILQVKIMPAVGSSTSAPSAMPPTSSSSAPEEIPTDYVPDAPSAR